MSLSHMKGPRLDDRRRAPSTREAWSAFWQEPGQTQCLSGSADISATMAEHWSAFAAALPPNARILDLGCGAGAVARRLVNARVDLQVTGIDSARVPLAFQRQFDLLADTEMEALPFADGSVAAVVSQFGYEYSRIDLTARELARVLSPDARLSFVVHHCESSIVASAHVRCATLKAFQRMRACFSSGNPSALRSQLAQFTALQREDPLAIDLAQILQLRVDRAPAERMAIWNTLEQALAPELCLSEALLRCCVAPERLDTWLAPLRCMSGDLHVATLHDGDERPLAWKIEATVVPGA